MATEGVPVVEKATGVERSGARSTTGASIGCPRLDMYKGFIACGGFSYGDTLGAGEGWARSILFNPALTEQFASFFQRNDTFALGVCNGCQMMAALSSRRGCRW